jgi:purine-cytosine permease-like protein
MWFILWHALLIGENFLTNFEDFLLLVLYLYLFVPWTAVNLVDYYVVRRGHYAIAEIPRSTPTTSPDNPCRRLGSRAGWVRCDTL